MSDEESPVRPRGVYWLPNLLTTGALFAGFYAIVAAIDLRFEYAGIAVFVAMLFDGLDGRVARWTNTASSFGKEYDSLSDMVSFGLAPAIISYQWGVVRIAEYGRAWGRIGWLAAFFYCVAAALRLARFNASLDGAPRPAYAYNFFTGVPAPGGAILALLPRIVFRHDPALDQGGERAEGAMQRRAEVDPGHGRAVRRVALACHVDRARHDLRDAIEADALGPGARIAEGRRRRENDVGLDRLQRFVVDAEAVLHIGAVILDDDIGLRDQLLEDRDAVAILEIERHRALVAIPVDDADGYPASRRSSDIPYDIALWRLDLDYVRAQVAEHHRGLRAGESPREVDDEKAGQRTAGTRRCHGSILTGCPVDVRIRLCGLSCTLTHG